MKPQPLRQLFRYAVVPESFDQHNIIHTAVVSLGMAPSVLLEEGVTGIGFIEFWPLGGVSSFPDLFAEVGHRLSHLQQTCSLGIEVLPVLSIILAGARIGNLVSVE